MAKNNAAKLVEEYIPLQIKYQSFADLVAGITELLAKKSERKYQLVSSRAKDPKKLKRKILEKKKNEKKEYKKLSDVEDLAGARIVFYLESDRKKFVDELCKELGDNSIIDVQEQDKPSGYRGTHVILKLDPTRASLPEYSDFKGMKCEVQITSSLYHAWSEVEHDIIYKPDGDKDKLMKLGLDRLQERFKGLHSYISGASIQLDLINEDYQHIRAFGKLSESNFPDQISKSSDNEEIFEILSLLERFCDKEPSGTFSAIEAIFSKKPAKPKVLGSLHDHKILGKTHDDLKIKSLELLSKIRYYKPKETLSLLMKLIIGKEKSHGIQAKKILTDFVSYDFNFIKQERNYGPQSVAFDFIKTWSSKELIINFDSIEIITKEILSSNVQGFEWTKEDTITHHSGSVVPTDFLKKIREETLDLLKNIYDHTKKIPLQLRILLVMQEAIRTPSSVTTPEIFNMINNDADHVLKIYENMIFNSKGKIIAPISVVTRIESHLYWWPHWKIKESESAILREKIFKDEFYKIYRLFVGDPAIDSYESQQPAYIPDREKEITNIFNIVSNSNVKKWGKEFNRIAKEKSFVEEWKFSHFKLFLRDLAHKKPAIADKLLKQAFKNSLPLRFFAEPILDGLRMAKNFKAWDEYVKYASKTQNIRLTRNLFNNLYVNDLKQLKSEISKEDLAFLSSVVKSSNNFNFLKSKKDLPFHWDLFRILCRVTNASPVVVEQLLAVEMKLHPELTDHFIDAIQFAIHAKSLEIKNLNKKIKRLLLQKLVEVRSLEWHSEELLVELGEGSIDPIFNVFISRIKHEEKFKKKRDIFDIKNHYDSIPYNFNPKLVEYIQRNPNFIKHAINMLGKMTSKWSIYNWQVSHLFERLGGPAIKTIVSKAITKGGEENLRNAAYFLGTSSGGDIDLCMEIAAKTNDRKILSLLNTPIYSTGIVSGEYGISEAYEAKAKIVEKYKESKNKKLRIFARSTIKNLEASARHARRSADEEKAKRKFDFER